MGCFSCNAGDEGGRISVQVEFLGDLLLSYFNLLQEKRLISGVLFAGSLGKVARDLKIAVAFYTIKTFIDVIHNPGL